MFWYFVNDVLHVRGIQLNDGGSDSLSWAEPSTVKILLKVFKVDYVLSQKPPK